MLRAPASIQADPELTAVFRNHADKVIPDPIDYSAWFDRVNERRRRIAVGSRRYSAVQDKMLFGRQPEWAHFLDPKTGDLMPTVKLERETTVQRRERLEKVRALMADRQRRIEQVATFGFQGTGTEVAR